MEVRDIQHRQMCTEWHRSSLVCTSVTSKPPCHAISRRLVVVSVMLCYQSE